MSKYGRGSGPKTYKNNRDEIKKDEIISSLIPGEISECALYLNKKPGEPCASDIIIGAVANVLDIKEKDPPKIISEAKSKIACDNEACVLSKLENKIGKDAVKAEISLKMKIKGPTDTSLLSNHNCDATLIQWAHKFVDFYPYNFNMINYARASFVNGKVINEPDTLATILWKDLYSGNNHYRRKYRCCGCVINSDKYEGAGKHWMALFADARRPEKWTVEFFNSSGNPPAPEWINWLVKTRDQMIDIAATEGKKPSIEIIKACAIRQQQTRSECGVYSLFYIWARLNGKDPQYFNDRLIPDQLMLEFRQHLFDDGGHGIVDGTRFSFKQYAKEVDVDWE